MAEPRSPPLRFTAAFRITGPGWIWLMMAAALAGTGIHKGINLVLLLACVLLVLFAMNGVLAWRQLRSLRLHRQIEEPVFAGVSAGVVVDVINFGVRPRQGIRIEQPDLDHSLGWFLPRLEVGSCCRLRGEIVWPRRGCYAADVLRLASSYPFGLAERQTQGGAADVVVVYPAVGRLHRGRLRRFLARAAASPGRFRRPPQHHAAARNEFHSLREFRSGDSPRWIHWRTTAHRGELMVREFEDAPTDNLVLILDTSCPDDSVDRFEETVTLAATICWEWCRHAGGQLVLAIAGQSVEVVKGVSGNAHGRRLLEGGYYQIRYGRQSLPNAEHEVISRQLDELDMLLARN
jgi:uncharacterized protein (DUF58 family)